MSALIIKQEGMVMNKIDLYWFSGTGNTLLLAKELQKYLISKGKEVRLLAMESSDPKEINPDAMLGLIPAVAVQGTYPLVWNFIEALPEVDGTNVFLLDSMGAYSGGIIGPVKRMLKKKGFRTLIAKEIIMPMNYRRKKIRLEKEVFRREKGLMKIKDFADKLLSDKGSWRDVPVYSTLMSLFSRSKGFWNMYRKYSPVLVDEKKCTRCDLCVKLCPVKHLNRSGETVPLGNGDSCIHCQRCFSVCPAQAIQYGRGNFQQYRIMKAGNLSEQIKKGNV